LVYLTSFLWKLIHRIIYLDFSTLTFYDQVHKLSCTEPLDILENPTGIWTVSKILKPQLIEIRILVHTLVRLSDPLRFIYRNFTVYILPIRAGT